MLTKCPECELQVSDKAIACPHCGYPLQPEFVAARKPRVKKHKHRRLPNGFGQISEIKNRNLRNPFRAMVTVGKTETGRPICKPLKPESYFRTYNDAYAALVEYNQNPYDLAPSTTVKELYDKWSLEYYKTLVSDSSVRTMSSAWAYCSEIYNMRAMDVRARHIKSCMENGTSIVYGKEKHTTPAIKKNIKTLFNMLFDYALEYELVDRNYARTFRVAEGIIREGEESKKEHMPFTDEEMCILWDNVDTTPFADLILIQCYSAWRPQELGLIELANVNLESGTMTGGMKTDFGKDRIVPIHSKIRPLVEKRYNEAVSLGSKYLFNSIVAKSRGNETFLSYSKYQYRFCCIMQNLNLNPEHRAHDGRKHFVTQAKKYHVDEYAIKYIVGHAINDLTEKVYTKRDTDWLREEIEKIK